MSLIGTIADADDAMDGDVDTDGVNSNIKLKLKSFNARLTGLMD